MRGGWRRERIEGGVAEGEDKGGVAEGGVGGGAGGVARRGEARRGLDRLWAVRTLPGHVLAHVAQRRDDVVPEQRAAQLHQRDVPSALGVDDVHELVDDVVKRHHLLTHRLEARLHLLIEGPHVLCMCMCMCIRMGMVHGAWAWA